MTVRKTLQHTATNCNSLQHNATHNTLQHNATQFFESHLSKMKLNTITVRKTLQHTATQRNTLQHNATQFFESHLSKMKLNTEIVRFDEVENESLLKVIVCET